MQWLSNCLGIASITLMLADPTPKDGDIRLSKNPRSYAGNIEIFHSGIWGHICDDDWDMFDATVACRQLGFTLGVARLTSDSYFGDTAGTIWMDNVRCTGSETRLTECKFDGFGVHDCSNTEAAGVECIPDIHDDVQPKISTFPTIKEFFELESNLTIRLANGRSEREGRVEVKFSFSPLSINSDDDMFANISSNPDGFGVICSDKWTLKEAMVVCRSLGHKFADQAPQTHMFDGVEMPRYLSHVVCSGNEKSLEECRVNNDTEYECQDMKTVASVICTDKLPDLVPDLELIRDSAYLHDQPLFYLQCAMEENCVSSSAYALQSQPDWHYFIRRLLRFSTRVYNFGDAAFRPFAPKETWEWHQCHMHHHSMEVFSHYDIIDDKSGEKVAEGHKASFCLEDSNCRDEVSKVFSCANYGDQGITVGCWDQYLHDIDCQWIDITDLDAGHYHFKVTINPEYRIAEKDYTNNAVICSMYYNQVSISLTNCSYASP